MWREKNLVALTMISENACYLDNYFPQLHWSTINFAKVIEMSYFPSFGLVIPKRQWFLNVCGWFCSVTSFFRFSVENFPNYYNFFKIFPFSFGKGIKMGGVCKKSSKYYKWFWRYHNLKLKNHPNFATFKKKCWFHGKIQLKFR